MWTHSRLSQSVLNFPQILQIPKETFSLGLDADEREWTFFEEALPSSKFRQEDHQIDRRSSADPDQKDKPILKKSERPAGAGGIRNAKSCSRSYPRLESFCASRVFSQKSKVLLKTDSHMWQVLLHISASAMLFLQSLSIVLFRFFIFFPSDIE